MLESGYVWKRGQVPGLEDSQKEDYYTFFKGLVEKELTAARAPKAEITANYLRVGNTIKSQVIVKNNSDVTLSSANDATLNMIVYEDIKTGLTSRTERAVVAIPITDDLASGQTTTMEIMTGNLTVSNWSRLHTLIFVDYIYNPSGCNDLDKKIYKGQGCYDMLQAAIAQPKPTLTVQPASIGFVIDKFHYKPADLTRTMTLTASLYGRTWVATENIPWLSLSPSSGTGSGTITATVDISKMTDGDRTGTITFTVTDPVWDVHQVMNVNAHLGGTVTYYLPFMTRK